MHIIRLRFEIRHKGHHALRITHRHLQTRCRDKRIEFFHRIDRHGRCHYRILCLFRRFLFLFQLLAIATFGQTQLIAAQRNGNVHPYFRQHQPTTAVVFLVAAVLALELVVPRISGIHTALQLDTEMRTDREMPTVTQTTHHRIALITVLLHLRIHPGYRPGIARHIIMGISGIEGQEAAVEHMAEPVTRRNPCRQMTPLRELRIIQREGIETRT